MYGANTATRTGNDIYALPIGNKPGTGWTAIVDAGGNDTITAEAATNKVTIDLRAATLAVGDQAAGGYRSSEFVTSGGFTIARGTVIENAIGGSNGDDLMGNDAGNMLRGNGGQDKIWGYAGNDLIYGDAAYDQIWAGLGNDTVFGGTDDDTLKGEDGNDQLFGETGWDDLYGGAGDDVLIGASGQDKLFGEDGNDLIRGDEEIDKIFAGSGNDTVNGGTESDQIDGEAGDDIVHGDDGHDYLRGDAGNDFLFGDIGADNIRGGAGNDMLCGGLNGDYLYGEAGKDIFFFDARPNKGAVDVLDFNVRDDTIKLSKSAFKLKAGTLNKNAFFKGAHAHDGDDRVIYNQKAGTLVYDADGTGARAEVVLAKIAKETRLHASRRDRRLRLATHSRNSRNGASRHGKREKLRSRVRLRQRLRRCAHLGRHRVGLGERADQDLFRRSGGFRRSGRGARKERAVAPCRQGSRLDI